MNQSLTKKNGQVGQPYANSLPEFDHIFEQHKKSEKNAWKVAKVSGLLLFIVTLILSVSLLTVIRTGGNHVFVVPVDSHGAPIAPARDLTYISPTPTLAALQGRLADCITAMYSVSPDNVVNRQNLTKAYACFAPAARPYLDSYYAAARGANSPFVAGRTETVEVIPQRIEAVSAQSFHIQWQQVTRSLTGTQLSSASHGATFTISLDPGPRSAAQIVSNPFGILITSVMADSNLQSAAQ